MALELNLTGYDAVLQYSAGVADPPSSAASFISIDNARDVNVTIAVDKVEVSDRSSRFKRYCPAMLDVEVTVEVTYNSTTAAFVDMCMDRTPITIAALDKTGGSGLYFTALCFSSDFSAPLADGQTLSLTFAPAKQSGVGAGGAPVWA